MTGRSERIARQFDISIRWTAFPLHPNTPPEGRSLEDLFKGRDFDIGAMLDRLRQVAKDLGLPFGDRRMTFNSRPAQELGKWAEVQGQGDAFHLAAFKAYFADGLNIYRTDILAKIAASVGLDPKAAASVVDDGIFRDAVDNDWARSRAMDITVVPTFAMAGEFIEGAQPYEAIEALLTRLNVPKREAPS